MELFACRLIISACYYYGAAIKSINTLCKIEGIYDFVDLFILEISEYKKTEWIIIEILAQSICFTEKKMVLAFYLKQSDFCSNPIKRSI